MLAAQLIALSCQVHNLRINPASLALVVNAKKKASMWVLRELVHNRSLRNWKANEGLQRNQ